MSLKPVNRLVGLALALVCTLAVTLPAIAESAVAPGWSFSGVELSSSSVTSGEAVTVTPQVTGDLGGATYNYVWQRNGSWAEGEWGSTVLSSGSGTPDSSATLSSEVSRPGTYTVYVDVTDRSGRTRTMSAEVEAYDDSWSLDGVSAAPAEVVAGDDVTCAPEVSGDASGLRYNYVWQRDGSWAEGDWGSTELCTGSDTDEASHTGALGSPGRYTLYVDAVSQRGERRTASTQVVAWGVTGVSASGSAASGWTASADLFEGHEVPGALYRFRWASADGSASGTLQDWSVDGDVNFDAPAGTRPNQVANTEVVTEVVTNAEGETEIVTEAPTEAAKVPETKEEIVEYFNTAINGVKPNATKVIHKSSAITLNGDLEIPGAIDFAMKVLGGAEKFIGDQLAKNSKGEQTYTGADITAKFPVEGEDYASKLTANDVASAGAAWSEDGKYLIVKIVAKSDAKSSTVKHGQGYAPKAFNVVLPGIVNDNVPSAVTSFIGGSAEMNYPSSTATITVDPATGRAISAEYDLKWTINFGTDTILPFTTLDSYTITY